MNRTSSKSIWPTSKLRVVSASRLVLIESRQGVSIEQAGGSDPSFVRR
jgi:hypothetical protein